MDLLPAVTMACCLLPFHYHDVIPYVIPVIIVRCSAFGVSPHSQDCRHQLLLEDEEIRFRRLGMSHGQTVLLAQQHCSPNRDH